MLWSRAYSSAVVTGLVHLRLAAVAVAGKQVPDHPLLPRPLLHQASPGEKATANMLQIDHPHWRGPPPPPAAAIFQSWPENHSKLKNRCLLTFEPIDERANWINIFANWSIYVDLQAFKARLVFWIAALTQLHLSAFIPEQEMMSWLYIIGMICQNIVTWKVWIKFKSHRSIQFWTCQGHWPRFLQSNFIDFHPVWRIA